MENLHSEINFMYFNYREEEKLRERALVQDLIDANKTDSDDYDEELYKDKFIFKAKPVPSHVKRNLFKKMVIGKKIHQRLSFLNMRTQCKNFRLFLP